MIFFFSCSALSNHSLKHSELQVQTPAYNATKNWFAAEVFSVYLIYTSHKKLVKIVMARDFTAHLADFSLNYVYFWSQFFAFLGIFLDPLFFSGLELIGLNVGHYLYCSDYVLHFSCKINMFRSVFLKGTLRDRNSQKYRSSLLNHQQYTLKLCFTTISVFRWNMCDLPKCLYGHHGQTFKKPWFRLLSLELLCCCAVVGNLRRLLNPLHDVFCCCVEKSIANISFARHLPLHQCRKKSFTVSVEVYTYFLHCCVSQDTDMVLMKRKSWLCM